MAVNPTLYSPCSKTFGFPALCFCSNSDSVRILLPGQGLKPVQTHLKKFMFMSVNGLLCTITQINT